MNFYHEPSKEVRFFRRLGFFGNPPGRKVSPAEIHTVARWLALLPQTARWPKKRRRATYLASPWRLN